MRWDDLFADLEAQVAAAEQQERAAEVGQRALIESARIALIDRVRPSLGSQLTLYCAGALSLTGLLTRLGPDWMVLDEGGGRESLVPLSAVVSLRGADRWSDAPDSAGPVESRLVLRTALRAAARDRSPVRVHLTEPGVVLDGTVDRVGADFLELAGHAPGELRRRRAVIGTQLVPFGGIAAIRRSAGG